MSKTLNFPPKIAYIYSFFFKYNSNPGKDQSAAHR